MINPQPLSPMTLDNPYADAAGPWLKGALHVHSTNSDGADHPHAVIADYRRLGYDFMALTDHRVVPTAEDLAPAEGMVVLAGCEYRGSAESELGVVGLRPGRPLPPGLAPLEMVEMALNEGAFTIYNHPNWHIHHWPVFSLLKIGRAHAIEVYNAVVEGMPGPAEASDKWDRLLSAGIRIFGVAADDAHTAEHRNKAWVCLRAEKDPQAILHGLRKGSFYSSNGPTLRAIRLQGNTLQVESEDGQEVRFMADRGQVRHRAVGPHGSYTIQDKDIYVRAEVYGQGASKAWTQPIWVKTERSRQLAEEFRQWYLGQQDRLGRV